MIIFSSAGQVIQESLKKYKADIIDKFFKERTMAIDYYTYDNTGKYIEDKFTGSINNEVDIYTTKLTKRLIDRISLVYKNTPNRTLESDRYPELIGQKDYKLKKIERIHNLLGTIAVRIKWNGTAFEYEPVLEFEPIFSDDDYINPIGIVYCLGHPDGSRGDTRDMKYVYWSDTEHFIFDWKGKITTPDGNNDGVNPYGVLPFIFIHNDAIDNFWTTGEGFDIAQTNKQIDQQLTQLAFKLRMSDGILACNGRVDANNIQIGLNKLSVIEDGNMYSVNPQTNIQASIEAIKDQLTLLSTNHHLSFDWGVNGSQSGVAIKLNNLELMESREDSVEKFRQLEKQIYNIERQIALTEMGINLPDSMFINFTEIEFPDPENERNKWDWLFSHNLASPIDYLMSKDAELTKEDAEELIIKNKELNSPAPANGNGLLQALGKPVE
tara:strand:+ start:8755 stop:10071 length:1317 start_codon:yes stop_codon:yes gene_type:complete